MKWYASALTLLVLGGFTWLADTSFVRNHVVGNENICSAQQIAALPKEVPFVALGSSRVRAGFSAELADEILGEELAPAYNLGRSGINIARNYRMLSDLINAGVRPKLAYVELDLLALEAQTRRPTVGVARDVGVLTFSDIVTSTLIAPDTSAVARTHIIALSFLQKIRSAMVLILSGQVPRSYLSVPDTAVRVCWRAYYDRRSPGKLRAIEEQRALYTDRYGDLATALREEIQIASGWRAVTELYYLDRIRELARANDITLIVSRHWRAYEPPLSPRSIATIQARIPEFRFPPAELVRESWGHFLDRTHMFDEARNMFTQWLVNLPETKGQAHAAWN